MSGLSRIGIRITVKSFKTCVIHLFRLQKRCLSPFPHWQTQRSYCYMAISWRRASPWVVGGTHWRCFLKCCPIFPFSTSPTLKSAYLRCQVYHSMSKHILTCQLQHKPCAFSAHWNRHFLVAYLRCVKANSAIELTTTHGIVGLWLP